MAKARNGPVSTIVPKIILVCTVINILFLVSEIVINVLGAMLPL